MGDLDNKKNCITSKLFSNENINSEIGLSFEEYEKIIFFITNFSDKFSSDILNSKTLNLSSKEKESKYYILRPITSLISYIIFDRIIRILKFCENNNIENIILCKYSLDDYFISRSELYANARDNQAFNEFIFSSVLKVKFDSEKKIKLIKHYNWDAWNGEESSILKKTQNKFLHYLRMKKWLLDKKFKTKKTNIFDKKILIKNIAYGIKFFEKNFDELECIDKHVDHNIFKILNKVKYDKLLRQKLSQELYSKFDFQINHLINEFNLNNVFKNKIDTKKTLDLFFTISPISILEGSDELLNFVKKNEFNNTKVYIDGFVGGLEISSAISGYLKSKNVIICGIQHSGRGGYLSNTPSIAELSILNTDYYITAGWKNIEKKLPIPFKSYYPLPSPNPNYLINSYKFKNNKTVLFSLGMWFKFPVMYDSAYYNENFKSLLNFIEKALALLSEKNFKIIVRLYCRASIKISMNFINRISKIKNIKIINDFKKGNSPKYFEQVDMALWDIPAGGFLECLNQNIPTASIGSKKFMRYQDGAENIINDMFSSGLLANTPKDLCLAVENVLLKEKRISEKKQIVINNFLKEYGWSLDEKASIQYYANFFNEIIK